MSFYSHLKIIIEFTSGKAFRFIFALFSTTCLFIAEIILGQLSKSVALTADAFYMLSDVIALIVGIMVVSMARKPTDRSTFGFLRAELVGTMVNSVLIMSLCFTILCNSIMRLAKTEKVKKLDQLIIVSSIGLGVNLMNIFVLRFLPRLILIIKNLLEKHNGLKKKGVNHAHKPAESNPRNIDFHLKVNHDRIREAVGENASELSSNDLEERVLQPNQDNLFIRTSLVEVSDTLCKLNNNGSNEAKKKKTSDNNTFGVIVHVAADCCGSFIVLVTSLLNKYVRENGDQTHWIDYMDPALSIVMCLLIIPSAFCLLKEAALTLMEVLPKNISIKEIISDLLENIPEIEQIHRIHIWKFIDNRVIATLHVITHSFVNNMLVLRSIEAILRKHGVHLCTVQLEVSDGEREIGKSCLVARSFSGSSDGSVAHALNRFTTFRSDYRCENPISILVEDFSDNCATGKSCSDLQKAESAISNAC